MFQRLRLLLAAVTCTAVAACSAGAPQSASQSAPAPDYAVAPLDLSTPRATAYSLMIAMYRGDVAMVDAVFADGGTLRRVSADGTVSGDARQAWQNRVSTFEVGQVNEEIFKLKIEQFENLATVWAPFVIRVNGDIAGCGVNHLAMVRDGENWRIAAGMDTPAPKESCAEFKAKILANE